jgi:hypothetical protein
MDQRFKEVRLKLVEVSQLKRLQKELLCPFF